MARPVGALGSKTLQAIGIVKEKGCDPLGILCDIAMGKPFMTKDGEVTATLDQIKDSAKELCQYIYPKRKAVEHSGIDGEDIMVVTRIERVIVDNKNDQAP